MGRKFDPKWTDEQKQAVAFHQVDAGHKPAATYAAARAGQLPSPDDPTRTLPAFDISYRYVADLATKERKHRRGEVLTAKRDGTTAERTDAMVNDCLALLEHEVNYLTSAASRQKTKGLPAGHVKRLREAVSAAREAKALGQGIATQRVGSRARKEEEARRAAAPKPPTRETAGSLVQRLTADHERQTGGHLSEAAPDTQHTGVSDHGENSNVEPSDHANLDTTATNARERRHVLG